MGREERKLKKHLQQKQRDELRKQARKERATHFRPGLEGGLSTDDSSREGLVVHNAAGLCTVLYDGVEKRCQCRVDAAIGDRVVFSTRLNRVERILPRSSVLSRPDPFNGHVERVIAANIDIVVHVVSVHSPPLRPALIDRYLIAIENAGAAPLICVNKIDLLGGEPLAVLAPYRELGIPVVECSAATGRGVGELGLALAGGTSVFTGHSGVGKSSLLNALVGNEEIATGAVSAVNRKGRHTTTSSHLYHLPGGGLVIDTPGIREFGLWKVTAGEVRRYFHEFDPFAAFCGFRDCSHTHEPVCGVKDALAEGAIDGRRYAAYLRIAKSVSGV